MLKTINPKDELDFLFEESFNAISYIDSNGILLKVNSLYSELYGFPKEELIGKNITFLFPNIDQEKKNKILQDYLDFFKKGENDFREEFILTKSGELKTVEVSRKFIRSADSSLICVSFVTDVSKHKNSNEKILNAVFNALSGVIYHVKIDANINRKMVFISEKADLIFFYFC